MRTHGATRISTAPSERLNAQRLIAERHEQKIERIARQLRERTPGTPLSLRKKGVSHVVPKRYDSRHTDEKIDISDLDEIIEIDPERMTCTAESGVTFTQLVRATLPYGLVP